MIYSKMWAANIYMRTYFSCQSWTISHKVRMFQMLNKYVFDWPGEFYRENSAAQPVSFRVLRRIWWATLFTFFRNWLIFLWTMKLWMQRQFYFKITDYHPPTTLSNILYSYILPCRVPAIINIKKYFSKWSQIMLRSHKFGISMKQLDISVSFKIL